MLMRYQLKFDGLVNEILDRLSEEVWKSETTTFFDPAMAGGQFIGQVIARLRSYGHSDENINGRVFGMECSKLMVTVVKNKYKIGTYWIGNINYEFKNMKFDVVLGNPPYQGTEEGSNSIWKKFIKFAFVVCEDNGYVCFVTPTGWLNDNKAKKQLQSKKLIFASLDVHSFFKGIGSSFSYWIAENTEQNDSNFEVVSRGEKFVINLNDLEFFPVSNMTEISINLIKKLLKFGILDFKGQSNFRDVSKVQTEKHIYPAYNTKAQPLVWIPYNNGLGVKKVIVQTVSTFEPFYNDGNMAVARQSAFIEVSSEEEAQNLIDFLNSKLFVFYFKSIKNNGWNPIKVPVIDFSKPWSDKELYEYFGLTKEEIYLIESNT